MGECLGVGDARGRPGMGYLVGHGLLIEVAYNLSSVPPATSNTNAATPAIPSTPSTATPPTASPPDLRPPCSDSSYIVRAWRHRRENVDEMAIEIMDGRANVTIYKWAWHEDSYVKEEMVVSAGSFRRGTYNFLGLAKIRKYWP